MAPIEAAAEDAFDDEVVGRSGDTDADAEVNLPCWRHVQIRNYEELLLLFVHYVCRCNHLVLQR